MFIYIYICIYLYIFLFSFDILFTLHMYHFTSLKICLQATKAKIDQ